MTGHEAPAARLHLLGGFELRVHGATVEIKPAPQRLLAMLALAGTTIQRGFAAGQLWPDASAERAQANLRTTMWRLRHVPCELVHGTKTHIRLGAEVWVDVREGLSDSGDVLRGPRSGTALLADLLPDWYDDWLDTERERIRQLRLAALERDGEVMLEAGHPADGIQLGLRAVALEPLRESAQRLVIRCHLAEGNLIEAVRQYERYAASLRRDLSAEPSPRMAELLGTFRRRAPALPS
ncbi:AfsR/SARP family transcriptional regulator [Paractinoplanes deccanensis]|uniref:AfsR/SARP family transcriptional regulator n=1 Tax=Paractinoplanes deccanensis TaxID=113561 RepID=UPI0019413F47|nr:BTAD domain-containing putative transcriptional regulator [Actinoplanes deccanensis]